MCAKPKFFEVLSLHQYVCMFVIKMCLAEASKTLEQSNEIHQENYHHHPPHTHIFTISHPTTSSIFSPNISAKKAFQFGFSFSFDCSNSVITQFPPLFPLCFFAYVLMSNDRNWIWIFS
jgi:hypothetical protein